VREPRWVPRILVEAIQFDQIQSHGGLAGLRDDGALESALARPRNRFAYGKKLDLATLAAAYAFGLARNHPFHDGNKRIAFLTATVFLGLNGYDLEVSDEDVIAHIVALAAGHLKEAKLAAWIRRHMRPMPAGAA
jgi:death-on-curing protein